MLRWLGIGCIAILFACEPKSEVERLVNHVIAEKTGLEIEFKNLHDSLCAQLPDSTQSELLPLLIKQGFNVSHSGRGNFSQGPRVVVKTLEHKDCKCTVSLHYYNTSAEGMYELRESLSCE